MASYNTHTKKIYYDGNSKVIQRLCERVNDDSLERVVIALQETVLNLIAEIYGAVEWIDSENDNMVTHDGDVIMFFTGQGNINDRLSALEAVDYLTYSEEENNAE